MVRIWDLRLDLVFQDVFYPETRWASMQYCSRAIPRSKYVIGKNKDVNRTATRAITPDQRARKRSPPGKKGSMAKISGRGNVNYVI
jgi:hypothetical protein